MMSFYEKLNALCIKNGVSVTALAIALGYSSSAATTWKNSKGFPRSSTIKKIADYFSVPVEYFYNADIEVQTVQDNHGIIGNTHAPVTINGSDAPGGIGEIEREILSICSKLDTKRKAALLARAYELLEEK